MRLIFHLIGKLKNNFFKLAPWNRFEMYTAICRVRIMRDEEEKEEEDEEKEEKKEEKEEEKDRVIHRTTSLLRS